MKGFVGFLLIFVLLAACQGSEIAAPDIPDYFPLAKGVYQIYDVQSKQYLSTAVKELTYEMKAEVIDSFPSGDTYTYVIHRSTRSSSNESWTALDTWSVRRDHPEIIVMEGNTPFVKMSAPYIHENVWDGNAYNNLGKDDYVLQEVDVPLDLNGKSFGKTLTVQQEWNDDPIVYRDQREEIYAGGVGLIYKRIIQLHYCTNDACLGQQRIEEGTEMTMVIKQYGKL
jgi:hypothetical protein